MIDNGVMYQDKHGIRYYRDEPDSDDDEMKQRQYYEENNANAYGDLR